VGRKIGIKGKREKRPLARKPAFSVGCRRSALKRGERLGKSAAPGKKKGESPKADQPLVSVLTDPFVLAAGVE